MKKLDKVLLLFFLLIGFGFSVCVLSLFFPVPFIRELISDNRDAYFWFDNALAIYSMIISCVFLLLMLLVLFWPAKANTLTIVKSKGILQFSRKTVESTVRYSFADIKGISHALIRVRLHRKPEKSKVFIRLAVQDVTALTTITESIQEKVIAALEASLGFTVRFVRVSVSEAGETPKKETDEVVSKDIRIV